MMKSEKRVSSALIAILVVVTVGIMLAVPLWVNLAQAQPMETGQLASVSSSANFCDLTLDVVGEGTIEVERNNVDAELNVEIAGDLSYVLLENSQLRVRYEVTEGGTQFYITEFTLKEVDQDQVGNGYMDAAQERGTLLSAQLLSDGTDKKTVRLEWASKPTSPFPDQTVIQDVTIYPNSPFLEITHVKSTWGFYFGDLARPGGVNSGQHVAYGGDAWLRGYDAMYPNYYYNRFPGDGVDDPANGGSLNYNDHFIVGVYNPGNGEGFGRVLPIADTRIIRLLFNTSLRQGFDFYPPDPGHAPYVSYLFGVTNGAEEILARGQQLADAAGGEIGYQCGEEVTLTAVPDEGSYFNYWEGDVEGSLNPISLVLSGEQTVTANFGSELLTVSLVPADGSGGTVSRSPDKVAYLPGEEVTITAEPADGWLFNGWTGDVSSTNAQEVVTMNDDVDVTATFVPEINNLTLNIVGNGDVTITPEKEVYDFGEIVILEAIPDPGWAFTSWTGAPAGNPTAIQMNGPKVVTATFTAETYTLNVAVQGDGSVQISPLKAEYVYGEKVTLTAVPGPGKFFGGWGGDLSGTRNPLELTMRGDVDATALFTDEPPQLFIYLPMITSQP